MSYLQQSVRNQTEVSTKLAVHLLSKKFQSNIVFSPLSLHVVLSILAAGSKGRTRDQLLVYLKANTTCELNSLYAWLAPLMFVDGSPYGGPRLSVANAVWVQKTLSLKPSFKEVVQETYEATCEQVDFSKANEAADEINLWAEKHTNSLIKKVIGPENIDPLTLLILANAVYFKGAWSEKFNEAWTKKLDFHLLDGNKVKVPFMRDYKYQMVKEFDDFKVLGLPYCRGQDKRKFTMYFFLPNAKDGLRSLVEKIGSTSDFLDNHIPRHKVEIGKFFIPKFKIFTGFNSTRMLNELGLILPFSNAGDFTEIVDSPIGKALSVSAIIHKSFVEVNEEGTEAAAVSLSFMCGSAPKAFVRKIPIDFVADHPFLFVIREDVSGIVLFMGHVVDPSIDANSA